MTTFGAIRVVLAACGAFFVLVCAGIIGAAIQANAAPFLPYYQTFWIIMIVAAALFIVLEATRPSGKEPILHFVLNLLMCLAVLLPVLFFVVITVFAVFGNGF